MGIKTQKFSHFRRLMVGLDFSQMDPVLIKYVAFIAPILQAESIYFVHIADTETSEDIFAAIRRKLNKTPPASPTKQLKPKIEALVEQHFVGTYRFRMRYEVGEGSPLSGMLQAVEVKDIDLLIVGRKKNLKGSGLLPERLSRKAQCAILFVPEAPRPRLQHLFLPIDFSKHAQKSVIFAIQLAKHHSKTNLVLQYIYKLSLGLHVASQPQDGDLARAYIQEHYQTFIETIPQIKKLQQPVTPVFSGDEGYGKAELIHKTATEHHADLIIIGAKGRTISAAMLLGSTTEKLIKVNNTIPLLVIKMKNTTVDLFDALLKG